MIPRFENSPNTFMNVEFLVPSCEILQQLLLRVLSIFNIAQVKRKLLFKCKDGALEFHVPSCEILTVAFETALYF